MIKNRICFSSRSFLLVIIFLMTLSFMAFAQSVCEADKFESEYTSLNSQFTSIKSNVTDAANYWAMVDLVDNIVALNERIKVCIKITESELSTIDQFLKEELNNTSLNIKTQHAIAIIQKQTMAKKEMISALTLLKYNINLTLNLATSYEKKNNVFNLMHKKNSVLETLHELSSNTSIQSNSLYQQSSLNQISREEVITLFGTPIIAFILGAFLIIQAQKTSRVLLLSDSKINKYVFIFVFLVILALFLRPSASTSNLIPVLRISLLYVFLCILIKMDLIHDPKKPLWPSVVNKYCVILLGIISIYNWALLTISNLSKSFSVHYFELRIPIYIILIILLSLMFITRDRTTPLESVMRTFLYRLFISISISFLCYLGLLITRELFPSNQLIMLRSAALLTLFNLALLWLNWLVFSTPYFKKDVSKSVVKIVKFVLIVMYFSVIGLCLSGYYYLGLLFIPNLLSLIMIFVLGRKLNKSLNQFTNNSKFLVSRKIHAYFGYQQNEKIFVLNMIRYILMSAFIILSIVAILQLFGGLTLYDTEKIFIGFKQNGVHFLGIVIYPIRLLRAAFVFCVLFLFGRRLALNSKKWCLSKDKNMMMLVYSITYYLSICTALILALIVAGINLTGLAIVSGTLSFGLGFGLQQFVKDLASGIYIIINKPIQVNDQVSIEGMDGVVKQIGLFSTQITTTYHSDLIVPNSKVTTDTIINYTFLSNSLYRLKIMIKLENDKDVEMGKQLLLEIAKNNSDVMHDHPYEPTVLFESNCLTLWCEIGNVNKRRLVLSDLNYTVKLAFNKKNIPMQLGAPK